MTTTSKSLLAFAVVGALAGLIAFFGLSPFGKQVIQQIAGSSTGTSFTTAKVAEINVAPVTAGATSTSIFNGDASTRFVTDGFVNCATSTGSMNAAAAGGLATWTWQMATTAVANLGLQGNTNYAENMVVGTSSTDSEYGASSTPPALVGNRAWPSGTYLTINTNGTSTNQTLSCQIGVHYLGS